VSVPRIGLLSTAAINGEIIAAAARSGKVAVGAVASRDSARAEAYAREHGLDRAHGSYDALLADPEVDAIYVSLPNGLHHEWTMRSLAAGKHVLCEKPYSRVPDEVEEAFAAAEAAGLVLEEAFMYRHHPQSAQVARLVREGAVGRLRAIRATFTFRLDRPHDPRWSSDLAGGSLMDVGCYCVSGSRLLAGEPSSVQGAQVLAESGVDLAFHGTLVFPDDVVAQIDSSFAAPRFQRLEAVGEEGTLVVEAPWRMDWGVRVAILRDRGVQEIEVEHGDSFVLELEGFAAAVAGEAPPLLGRADAFGQARAIDALYRSAESGASVAL
jgi:predicted dehydrogenase